MRGAASISAVLHRQAGAFPSNVVDLRRWRQERDLRLRQAVAEVELPGEAAPGRISWPFRILALLGGLGFLAFGAFLAGVPWLLRLGSGGGAWSLYELLLFLLGGAIALFGIDVAGRGLGGREWLGPSWHRLVKALTSPARRDTIPPGSFSRRGGR